VRGPDAADADFRALASAPEATATTFVAWASAQASPRDRARVLEEARGRFPDHAGIAAMRATTLRDSGDHAAALSAAGEALRLDPTRAEAWVVLVDATVATRGRGALGGVLDRFDQLAMRDPALAAGLAQQLAGYARTPDDPLIARVLAWLDAILATEPERTDVSLARARVLIAAERWDEALAITDGVVASAIPDPRFPAPDPPDPALAPALRLRAETLAYRGDHAAAVAAFDDYLALAPDDLAAARLQARAAGWGRQFDESRARYRALVSRYPAEEALVAEANAKQAFHEGRWRDAARQYRRWLELEPANREAAFELAQSMQADGDQPAAIEVYRSLVDGPRAHRVGADAMARAQHQQAPSVAPYVSAVSSDGYGGQWLLDWNEAGGNVTFAPGTGHRLRFAAEGGAVTARNPGWMRTGYRAGAAAAFTPVARVTFDVGASVIDVDQPAGSTVEAVARATWSVVDRWRAAVAFERSLVKENAATVDANLMAQGIALGAAFESPRAVSNVRARLQSLSDGNSRQAVEVSAGWTIRPGRSEWRAVTWNQWTGYGRSSPFYFSPSSFWRTDVGLEWRGWLAPMRFRGDRERFVSAGYATGFDNHGEIYHRPAVGVGFEFASGLAFEARGSWLLSDVFDQTDAFVGLRIGGASVRVH
jgi:tetratricopeptide (TPR) repeat protein